MRTLVSVLLTTVGWRGGSAANRPLAWIRALLPRVDRPVDDEFLNRRVELLVRVARAVAEFPDVGAGDSHFVTLHVHPSDTDLVGTDVIDDERLLKGLLVSLGVVTPVRVHDCIPDSRVIRGRVEVRQVAAVRKIPATRAYDGSVQKPALPTARPKTSPCQDARLVRIGQPAESLSIPVTGGVIGRDAILCQLVVDVPTVSRRHALIRPRSSGFMVEDLDSANGLSINSRVTELGVLHDGDILGLGRTVTLRLEVRRHGA